MEVIRHGNTYKEIECKRCTALLSYCAADIKDGDSRTDYYNDSWHYFQRKYIVCPECKEQINISWIVDGKEQINDQ